jgi:large subunit ribosomal protein L25
MAKTETVAATIREDTGKGAARRLRAAGRVPAVIYGHGEETRALSVDAHELDVLFSHISVENTVIELSIAGGKGRKKPVTVRALVREVQRHPYRPGVMHVDFYELHAGERIEVEVPLRLVGAAAGVKAGGLMQHSLHELEIRCLSESIPDALEVEVSALEIGDSIHVRDLVVPAGVEIITESGRTVCAVIPPTVVPVEAEEAAAEPTEIAEAAEPELVRRRPEGAAEAGEAEEE